MSTNEQNASFRRGLVEAFKEATKACIAEARGEHKVQPLEAYLQALVGSPKPIPFTLSNPQLVKEPYWWILFLQKGDYESSAFVDDFDVPGAVALALEKGLLIAYTSSVTIPNEYVRSGINAIVADFLQMAAMYLAIKIDQESDGAFFVRRVKHIIASAQNRIDLLDRDNIKKTIGAKEAQRFLRALRANDKMYSQRSTYALRFATKGQGQGGQETLPNTTSLTEEPTDRTTAPRKTKKNLKKNQKKTS